MYTVWTSSPTLFLVIYFLEEDRVGDNSFLNGKYQRFISTEKVGQNIYNTENIW